MNSEKEKWIYRDPKTGEIITDRQVLKAYFYQCIELEIIENGIVIGYTDTKQYN